MNFPQVNPHHKHILLHCSHIVHIVCGINLKSFMYHFARTTVELSGVSLEDTLPWGRLVVVGLESNLLVIQLNHVEWRVSLNENVTQSFIHTH